MKRSLIHAIEWSSLNPGYIQDWCKYWFEYVQVGYIRQQDKLQIACFDERGECRLCIWYQYRQRSGLWTYDIYPGRSYQIPEEAP